MKKSKFMSLELYSFIVQLILTAGVCLVFLGSIVIPPYDKYSILLYLGLFLSTLGFVGVYFSCMISSNMTNRKTSLVYELSCISPVSTEKVKTEIESILTVELSKDNVTKLTVAREYKDNILKLKLNYRYDKHLLGRQEHSDIIFVSLVTCKIYDKNNKLIG